ncbi:MAG: hypothetical protein JKY48_16185 [Flavobacteriales bacterium]|nr:hypothetical protein [Flavobacteriales bacterium]
MKTIHKSLIIQSVILIASTTIYGNWNSSTSDSSSDFRVEIGLEEDNVLSFYNDAFLLKKYEEALKTLKNEAILTELAILKSETDENEMLLVGKDANGHIQIGFEVVKEAGRLYLLNEPAGYSCQDNGCTSGCKLKFNADRKAWYCTRCSPSVQLCVIKFVHIDHLDESTGIKLD